MKPQDHCLNTRQLEFLYRYKIRTVPIFRISFPSRSTPAHWLNLASSGAKGNSSQRRKTFTGCLTPSAQWQSPWVCSFSHWPLSNIGHLKNYHRGSLKIQKTELVLGKVQEGKFQMFPKKCAPTLNYKFHGCQSSIIVTNWGLRNRTWRHQQLQDTGERKAKRGWGGLGWHSLNRALALAPQILASITTPKSAMWETPAILALETKVRKTTHNSQVIL